MHRLKKLWRPESKEDATPQDHKDRFMAASISSPNAWWSGTLPLNEEQAAAVSKYVRELPNSQQLHIRAVMLGKDGVGRTCVAHRLVFKEFLIVEGYDPTKNDDLALHVDVDGKIVQYDGQYESSHVTWATQDFLSDSMRTYYIMRHCEVCLFVYDVSDRSSFEAVKGHYKLFLHERSLERPSCPQECSPNCMPRPPHQGLKFVIANKMDREEKDWEVTREEGEEFSTSIGGTFILMSAKTGEGTYEDLLADMTRLVFLRRVYFMVLRPREYYLEAGAAADLHTSYRHNRMFWY